MCFSNLPVEFDAEGNPRLAGSDDEETGHDHDHDHGRDATTWTDDDGLDPEARYREILDALPDRARDRIDDGPDERRGEPRPITE